MGNPKGQPVDTTQSGGLNVREYWTQLFQQNEELFRAHRYVDILTDIEITEAMFSAFPDRIVSALMKQVVRVRGVYNRGVWFNGMRPRLQSRRYRRIGDGTCVAITARGRLL
jgi:hypothetical protein